MKKTSKIFIMLLVLSMLFSTFVVFATTKEEEANKLSIDEIIKRVDKQLLTYMEGDSQGKDRGIYANPNLIPLYDLDETIVAYIVPLYDKNENEVGYMITSAYATGSVMCELSLDNILASDFQNVLTENKKLTYLSLMNYGLKANSKTNDSKYYFINQGNIRDFIDNKEILSEFSDNNLEASAILTKHIVEIDQNVVDKINNFTSNVKVSKSRQDSSKLSSKTIDLSTVDTNFWGLITSPANTYYGGDQSWWTDGRENYGCGPVAAANIMAYYDKYHSLTNLYSPSGRSKANFLTHMNNVEAYVASEIFGIATIGEFVKEVEKYSEAFNNPVYAHWNAEHEDYESTLDGYSNYVMDGLTNEYPVAYLQWLGEYDDFDFHWMTITKYFQNTEGRWVAISSWSVRYSLDFELVCQTFGGGLMYFDI